MMIKLPKIRDRLTEDEIRQQIRQTLSVLNEAAGTATYTLGALEDPQTASVAAGSKTFSIKNANNATVSTGTFQGQSGVTADAYQNKNVTAPNPSEPWSTGLQWTLQATLPAGQSTKTVVYPIKNVVVTDAKKEEKTAKGGASKPAPAAPQAPAAPAGVDAAPLTDFLSNTYDLYKSAAGAPTDNDKAKIKGAWGPTATAALTAFIKTATPESPPTPKRAWSDDRYKFVYDKVKKQLDDLLTTIPTPTSTKKPPTLDLNVWQGVELAGETFGPNPTGLVQFLKFSYILRGVTGTASDAAKAMGYDDVGESATSTEAAFNASRFVGALTPYDFVTVAMPEGVKFAKGARLEISLGGARQRVAGTSAGADVITVKADENTDIAGEFIINLGKAGEPAAVLAAEADKLVRAGAGGSPVVWTLIAGRKSYSATVTGFKAGARVELKAPEAAPGGYTYDALSGSPSGQTREGRTEEGEKVVSMTAIIVKNDGGLDYSRVPVKIKKDVSRKRDGFTITVTKPEPTRNGAIFVPVRLPERGGVIREAFWVTRFVAPAEDAEGGGGPAPEPKVALMPVTELNYNFDGNYVTYGSSALPPITTVSFTPYDRAFDIPGLNVKTAGQLLQLDGINQGTLDAAVLDYLASKNNPMGGTAIQTVNVLDTMNSFPQRTYRF